VGNGPRAERVAGERLRHGGGELGRAVVVEQPEQPGRVRAERFAARRQPLEDHADRRHCQAQSIAPGGRGRRTIRRRVSRECAA